MRINDRSRFITNRVIVWVAFFLIGVNSISYPAEQDSILQGLKNYMESYNRFSILALTYQHIVEKPTHSKEEATKMAYQKIRSSTKLLFGKEYTPDLEGSIQEYIKTIDFDGMVKENMLGSTRLPETIQVIFSHNDFEHIVVSSDGSLMYNQKYDHNQKKRFECNPTVSKNNQFVEKSLINKDNPKAAIWFLFRWSDIISSEGLMTTEQLNDNTFRVTKQEKNTQYVLEVQKKEDCFIPLKFVADVNDSHTETTYYKDYANQKGVLTPSFIVIDIVPKENATDLMGFLGTTRLIYKLE
ncbi:MAG: hypothetical protein AB1656_11625 [Candidatus Omnitrophota bacterium]